MREEQLMFSALRLKEARARVRLTQEQVAHSVGVALSTYKRWESMSAGTPHIGHLPKLVNALSCDVWDLFSSRHVWEQESL